MQRSSRSKLYHHEKTSGLFWHLVFKELSKLTYFISKKQIKKRSKYPGSHHFNNISFSSHIFTLNHFQKQKQPPFKCALILKN